MGTIPQIFLSILIGSYALGIYSGGIKVYSIIVMFYVTFFYAIAPYLVQLNKKPVKTQMRYHLLIFVVTLIVSSLIGIFLYLFGEPIVLLILGKSFGESVSVFKISWLSLIPMLPIVILLGNILIYNGYEKYYLISLIVDGVIIIATSVFFIKQFGAAGAVYSLAISMAITILVLIYYYFRMFKTIKNDF